MRARPIPHWSTFSLSWWARTRRLNGPRAGAHGRTLPVSGRPTFGADLGRSAHAMPADAARPAGGTHGEGLCELGVACLLQRARARRPWPRRPRGRELRSSSRVSLSSSFKFIAESWAPAKSDICRPESKSDPKSYKAAAGLPENMTGRHSIRIPSKGGTFPKV